jgi:hypothetical protein
VTRSIFPKASFDRTHGAWEDMLYALTPVERIGNLWFKREDAFAPLGFGGINGSKLRQCIWLVNRYVRGGGRLGLLSGASVLSPQLVMGTAVAAHYGLPSTHVIGGTTVESAQKNPSVEMASALGAEWVISKVGYNPALQSTVRKLLASTHRGWFHLEYGISLDHTKHPAEDVAAFHHIGAQQVGNLPMEVETLVIPAGSCNSATSILYGLSLWPPPGLRRVILVGIGPSKEAWMRERLAVIAAATKTTIDYLAPKRFAYEYHDLHEAGVKYHDKVPWRHGIIEFHPTYEGKVMRYLTQKMPDVLCARGTGLWIIGSAPQPGVMLRAASVRAEAQAFSGATKPTN